MLTELERLMLQRIDGCFQLAAVEICASVDIEHKKVSFTIKIDGKLVFSGMLDENNLCVSPGDLCYERVCLNDAEICVDWKVTKITIKGVVCLWSLCREFDAVLLDW